MPNNYFNLIPLDGGDNLPPGITDPGDSFEIEKADDVCQKCGAILCPTEIEEKFCSECGDGMEDEDE